MTVEILLDDGSTIRTRVHPGDALRAAARLRDGWTASQGRADKIPRELEEVGSLLRLSARQSEVLDLLRRGMRPRAIAQELHVSVHTARNHIKAIYKIAGVRSAVELVASLQPRAR